MDLSATGLGLRPTDPVRPPERWREVQTSAHTLLKAYRVVAAVEQLAFGLGVPRDELVRLRPLLLVVEAAVYAWDSQVEDDQRHGIDGDQRDPGDRLLALVGDIVVVDDGMRAEVEGLRRLFWVETEALRAAASERLFREVSRWRSSDLRLQLRVICSLMGWSADEIVELLQPRLELLEVEDDLSTAVEDELAGSFNSFWFLRRSRSADATRDYLDAFAADQTRLLGEGLRRASDERFRQLFVSVCHPRSPSELRVLRALARLPRPLLQALVDRTVLPQLRRSFSASWQRPEFR